MLEQHIMLGYKEISKHPNLDILFHVYYAIITDNKTKEITDIHKVRAY